MTNFKQKAKKFYEEHNGDIVIAGLIAVSVGALVIQNNGYKQGYKIGYEAGCKDMVKALNETLENLKLLEKHQILPGERLVKVANPK